jgi:hypothetical protein
LTPIASTGHDLGVKRAVHPIEVQSHLPPLTRAVAGRRGVGNWETLYGDIGMNRDTGAYRVIQPGFEDDPAHGHGHGHGHIEVTR